MWSEKRTFTTWRNDSKPSLRSPASHRGRWVKANWPEVGVSAFLNRIVLCSRHKYCCTSSAEQVEDDRISLVAAQLREKQYKDSPVFGKVPAGIHQRWELLNLDVELTEDQSELTWKCGEFMKIEALSLVHSNRDLTSHRGTSALETSGQGEAESKTCTALDCRFLNTDTLDCLLWCLWWWILASGTGA